MWEEQREGRCSLWLYLKQHLSTALKVRKGVALAEDKGNIPVQGTASQYNGLLASTEFSVTYKWVPSN